MKNLPLSSERDLYVKESRSSGGDSRRKCSTMITDLFREKLDKPHPITKCGMLQVTTRTVYIPERLSACGGCCVCCVCVCCVTACCMYKRGGSKKKGKRREGGSGMFFFWGGWVVEGGGVAFCCCFGPREG